MSTDQGLNGAVAVTGAAGFLGRRIVRRLAERGRSVTAIVRRSPPPGVLDYPNVTVARADIRDRPALVEAMEEATTVVHTAAILRERGSATYSSVNVEACETVYSAAAEAGVQRAVHISVVAASNDAPAYSASRWQGEQIALRSSLKPAILRLSALFGEGDEFTNTLAALVRLGPLVPVIGSGRTKFQPLSVDDAAEAAVLAADGAVEPGKVVELGGPEVLTYNEIMDAIAAAMGRRIFKLHVPVAVFKPLVWGMEKVLPTSPVTSTQLQMLHLDNVAQGDSFETLFDFAPKPMAGNIDYVRGVGIREALKITLGRPPSYIRDH